jgi:uncharacterized damage-inducible protein DinB
MKENELVIRLFEKLFDGSPWIDVNLMDTLNSIDYKKASIKPQPDQNSIWEVVNHLINWRLNVLQRVQGKVIKSPDNNYFEPITAKSQAGWEKTLVKLKDSQSQWIKFLKGASPDKFQEVYAPNKMSYYEHIHGILQHDAYHLGQIRLLVRYL